MAIEGKTVAGRPWMFIVGWILSIIPILMMGPMAIVFAIELGFPDGAPSVNPPVPPP